MTEQSRPFLENLHRQFAVQSDTVISLITKTTRQPVETLRRIVRGYDNEVYQAALASGSIVYARINRNPGQDLDLERWTMDQARGAGVPVPEVVTVQSLVEPGGRDLQAMVMMSASGTQLSQLLPSLDKTRRKAAFSNLGSALRTLHTVRTPGFWRPDEDGRWATDWETATTGWVADRRDERDQLLAAGLRPDEIDQALQLLATHLAAGPTGPAVLCHGDPVPEHIFVGGDLRVSGLIDFGMWCGAEPIGELAYLAFTCPDDLRDVIDGYGADLTSPAAFQRIHVHALGLAMGNLAHEVDTGDHGQVRQSVAGFRIVLRRAQT